MRHETKYIFVSCADLRLTHGILGRNTISIKSRLQGICSGERKQKRGHANCLSLSWIESIGFVCCGEKFVVRGQSIPV